MNSPMTMQVVAEGKLPLKGEVWGYQVLFATELILRRKREPTHL